MPETGIVLNSPGISEDFKREGKIVDEDIMLGALKMEGKSRHVHHLLPLLSHSYYSLYKKQVRIIQAPKEKESIIVPFPNMIPFSFLYLKIDYIYTEEYI